MIDDDFIPIDGRTQQKKEDDDNISLINIDIPDYDDSDNDAVTIEDVPELSVTTNTSKNPFIVTIEDVLEPPTINQAPPLPTPKTLDVDINALSDDILKNIRPVDNRNLQNLIEDDFIPIDDRTQQEREDDDKTRSNNKTFH